MNEQAINVAIALECGWERRGPDYWVHERFDSCDEPPNYTGDLNAIHDAVKTLTFSQRRLYRFELQGIMSKGLDGDCLVEVSECIDATAKQRAGAFLRTVGKWVEE